jgi:thiamine-monophosphate kinase
VQESQLLEHIYERSRLLPERFGQVLVGPGDDCAVVATPGGGVVLATTDQIISGRHFRPGTPVDRIARKLIARSVSDIAAMGGTPSWALATGALPSDYEHADQLFDAMATWGARFGCPLVGGDIATLDGGRTNGNAKRPQVSVGGQKVTPSFVGKMVLTCTVIGTPHPTRGPVLRSAARPGDEVWVSGRLGGSLHSGRHLAFAPRVREGRWLCDYLAGDLHAMIDISDGLGRDAGRIATASGVRLAIDEPRLPLHEDVHTWRNAVGDGEDYELCFCIEPGSLGIDGHAVCRDTGTPLTRVGRVETGAPGSFLHLRSGEVVELTEVGWDHGDRAGGGA